ncbi:MAG: hypothetical protein M1546_25835, partial [Chloroflexi bacterium]|nr:hypothetical protein [Chloroflexota bacterium]
LSPSDEQSFSALQEEVESTSRELKQVIAGLPKEALAFEVEKGLRGVGALMPGLLAAPSILPPGEERRTMFAQWRLGAFVLGSYVIIIALLAGAGFSELYVTKATFGAEPWRDYFALLAWGFGAEATRAAVLGLVSGWGLPGIRRDNQGVGEGVAPG